MEISENSFDTESKSKPVNIISVFSKNTPKNDRGKVSIKDFANTGMSLAKGLEKKTRSQQGGFKTKSFIRIE
jgi:hypothetical protein